MKPVCSEVPQGLIKDHLYISYPHLFIIYIDILFLYDEYYIQYLVNVCRDFQEKTIVSQSVSCPLLLFLRGASSGHLERGEVQIRKKRAALLVHLTTFICYITLYAI